MAEESPISDKHWIFKDLNFQIKAGEFVLSQVRQVVANRHWWI